MAHVDVVKNEWLAGFQLVVARVNLEENNTLRVVASDPHWEGLVMQPLTDPKTGQRYEPADGVAFLNALHNVLQGDYVFATEAHDEGNCPFHDLVVPIQSSVDAGRSAQLA